MGFRAGVAETEDSHELHSEIVRLTFTQRTTGGTMPRQTIAGWGSGRRRVPGLETCDRRRVEGEASHQGLPFTGRLSVMD